MEDDSIEERKKLCLIALFFNALSHLLPFLISDFASQNFVYSENSKEILFAKILLRYFSASVENPSNTTMRSDA